MAGKGLAYMRVLGGVSQLQRCIDESSSVHILSTPHAHGVTVHAHTPPRTKLNAKIRQDFQPTHQISRALRLHGRHDAR